MVKNFVGNGAQTRDLPFHKTISKGLSLIALAPLYTTIQTYYNTLLSRLFYLPCWSNSILHIQLLFNRFEQTQLWESFRKWVEGRSSRRIAQQRVNVVDDGDDDDADVDITVAALEIKTDSCEASAKFR